MKEKKLMLDGPRLQRAIRRMSNDIASVCPDLSKVVLVGIRTRGGPLAKRISANLLAETKAVVATGILDVTLYRDDLEANFSSTRVVKPTKLPEIINEKTVILVDDVFYTGRTVRAALDALIDFGRPSKIMLAALINRIEVDKPEMPIFAKFVGKHLQTISQEHVRARLTEIDGEDSVWIMEL